MGHHKHLLSDTITFRTFHTSITLAWWPGSYNTPSPSIFKFLLHPSSSPHLSFHPGFLSILSWSTSFRTRHQLPTFLIHGYAFSRFSSHLRIAFLQPPFFLPFPVTTPLCLRRNSTRTGNLKTRVSLLAWPLTSYIILVKAIWKAHPPICIMWIYFMGLWEEQMEKCSRKFFVNSNTNITSR